MNSSTSVDITRGFWVKVCELNGCVFLNLRRYYTDHRGGQLKPGIPGITLNHESWNTLKEKMPGMLNNPDGFDCEMALGKDKAIGRYQGEVFLCRYNSGLGRDLDYKRDYVILTENMMQGLQTAEPLIDADFQRARARVNEMPRKVRPGEEENKRPTLRGTVPPLPAAAFSHQRAPLMWAEVPQRPWTSYVPAAEVLGRKRKAPATTRSRGGRATRAKKIKEPPQQPNIFDREISQDECEECGTLKPVTAQACSDDCQDRMSAKNVRWVEVTQQEKTHILDVSPLPQTQELMQSLEDFV